jgi:hypothetical protein
LLRILLVHPEGQRGLIGFRIVALPEPLALEILASVVPDHETLILDLRVDDDLAAVFSPTWSR